MRKLFAAALAVGLVAPVLAQEPKKTEASLKVGDPAPPFKPTKWLQGPEVKSFEKGTVYVVEFWATWCGPCIVMMPHMSDLQQEYKGKAVFASFTTIDKRNPAEKVAAFVEKRGPKLKYGFAASDSEEINNAWMKASGQSGIPCCFVIDKETKIAYIGHPMYLDEILPRVLAGTWTKDDAAAMAKVDEEVDALFGKLGGDPEAALKALADFEKNHPKLGNIPYFVGPKIATMLKAKKPAEARKYAEEAMAKAVKADDPMALRSVSAALASEAGGDKEVLALALKAAEAGLKVSGDKDALALLGVADAHFAAGDKKQAKEFGAKALAAAESESEGLKNYVARQVKRFEE